MGPRSGFAIRRPCFRRPTAIGAVALALVAICAALATRGPQALINTTPSEPRGLYVKTHDDPGRGRIIAFPAPAAAFPYAERRLAYLHRTPLLKAVAAGPGDHVCTLGGRLRIAGQVKASIVQNDREGVPLPHWNGCRRLEQDELFVFSDRVPNSFDSRYFGPVRRTSVLGVYAPLVVLASGGR